MVDGGRLLAAIARNFLFSIHGAVAPYLLCSGHGVGDLPGPSQDHSSLSARTPGTWNWSGRTHSQCWSANGKLVFPAPHRNSPVPCSVPQSVSSVPLSFRTAGFPQHGWKAGISGSAFPKTSRFASALRVSRGNNVLFQSQRLLGKTPPFAIRVTRVTLPQGLSLRSGLYRPGSSTLNRPHAPHSQIRRHFPAELLTGSPDHMHRAFTARSFSACRPLLPRRSTACQHPVFRRWHWPSPSWEWLGKTQHPTPRSTWG